MKKLLIGLAILSLVAVVGVVLASACDDLSECAETAEQFCDEIQNSKADSARITEIAEGDECECTCSDSTTIYTYRCVGPA